MHERLFLERYLDYDEAADKGESPSSSPSSSTIAEQQAAHEGGGGVVDSIVDAIRAETEMEATLTMPAAAPAPAPAGDARRSCTRLGRVVAGWLGLLPDAARSWGRFEQFLGVMEGVSDMGDRERDLLLNRRVVCHLSSFFLQVNRVLYCAMFFCSGGGGRGGMF